MSGGARPPRGLPKELNERQKAVLKVIAHGGSQADAALKLGISKATVTDELTKARHILCAKTTIHAIVLAVCSGDI